MGRMYNLPCTFPLLIFLRQPELISMFSVHSHRLWREPNIHVFTEDSSIFCAGMANRPASFSGGTKINSEESTVMWNASAVDVENCSSTYSAAAA